MIKTHFLTSLPSAVVVASAATSATSYKDRDVCHGPKIKGEAKMTFHSCSTYCTGSRAGKQNHHTVERLS